MNPSENKIAVKTIESNIGIVNFSSLDEEYKRVNNLRNALGSQ